MTRTVSIQSGGDWNDASCDHLDIPDDIILADAYLEYDDWLKNVYYKLLNDYYKTNDPSKLIGYISFIDWLIKNKGAVESKIEEFSY